MIRIAQIQNIPDIIQLIHASIRLCILDVSTLGKLDAYLFGTDQERKSTVVDALQRQLGACHA